VSEFDTAMQVFDIRTNESHVIPSSGSELTTVAFVPTTSFAVTGDLGGQIRLWDIDTLQQGDVIGRGEGQITALDVSSSGRRIAAGTLSGHYYVFNRRDKKVVVEGEVGDSIVLAVEFNRAGTELYISSIDGTVMAMDISNGSVLWKRAENSSDVIGMEYVQSRNAILAATASKTLQLIDAKTGEILESKESTGGVLRDIELFQDETRFVTVSSDGTVGVWDSVSLNLVASLPAQQSLECVSVSRDGHRLAIGGGSATIQMMDGMSRSARLKNSTHEQTD
jgi:WD40 repeat protein